MTFFKGDIVLISFPFTNLNGEKLRPAVILIDTNYDVTVCFVSSQLRALEKSDVILKPNTKNGLKKDSFIKTSKIATLDKTLIKGQLGKLDQHEIELLNEQLRILFQLSK